MTKKIFLSLAFVFLLLTVFSQKTIIKGTVKNTDFQKIRLLTFADQISYREKTIASSEIDNDGQFSMEFELSQTIYSYLAVGFQKAELYLEPGKIYKIEVTCKNNDKPFSFTDPLIPDIKFKKPANNNLNTALREFNFLYNDFIINNFNKIYKQRKKHLIDTLEIKANKISNITANKFFEDYVKFKLATIEQMAGIKDKNAIFRDYFINKKVLYHHIEYMSFFNSFFAAYFKSNSNKISIDRIREIINNKNTSITDLTKEVKKDNLLNEDSRIAELVLLKNLYELYYTYGFNKEKIIKFIKNTSEEGEFSQNRKIAKSLISSINKLKPGTAAPGFSLPSINNTISLNDFKGKYLYINFWNSNCLRCIKEMDSIQKIQDKLKNKLNFLSISTDTHPAKAKKIIEEKNYNWQFLHYNNDIELLENYNVKMLPVNILISRKSNILSCPAVEPGWKLLNLKLQ